MKVLTDNQYYGQIADVIREQNGTSNTYKPQQMVRALKDLFYEEVEGVPPISFNGIGENLLDYRIDGASGGVGDLITDSSDENFGKYKVPVVISGKNLFDEIYTNIAGGWNVNYKSIFVGEGTFTLSTTCPKQDDGNATNLFFLSGNVSTGANSGTNGVYNNYPVTVTSLNGYVTIGYRALSYDPQDYTTMLNEGTTALPYEPFTEPTTTNIYLDKPIEAKANIPSEYTEVEYLESTGTQYIDTGIVPNTDSGFKTKIVFTGHTNGIDDFLIGVRSNSTYGRFAYTCTSNTFYCSFGSSTSSLYRYNANMPSTEIIECELNYKNSNTTITQGVEGLLSDKNKFNGEGLTFYLAGAYNAKGIPKYRATRQYKCELTQGTEVVRDLVPCYRKSDNVAGLYDLVNNTFYTNQGTGNFIVGPIKENESISLSDTNTNIPTIRGTNVLTVDTTVQPSNVYVKSRHESSYETAMRERYEEAQAQLDALESEGE